MNWVKKAIAMSNPEPKPAPIKFGKGKIEMIGPAGVFWQSNVNDMTVEFPKVEASENPDFKDITVLGVDTGYPWPPTPVQWGQPAFFEYNSDGLSLSQANIDALNKSNLASKEATVAVSIEAALQNFQDSGLAFTAVHVSAQAGSPIDVQLCCQLFGNKAESVLSALSKLQLKSLPG